MQKKIIVLMLMCSCVVASAKTRSGLDVVASEPPAAHANIEGWPWLDDDPELQKARQLACANQIAAEAIVVAL